LANTIVITGAGAGLGRALARRFAGDGETVILVGRTIYKLAALADELGMPTKAVECDISCPDSVRAAFAEIAETHPKIDVLINNAAVYEPFMITDASDDQILSPILTNFAGQIFCARAAITMMGRGGHVINVSSEAVAFDNYPMLAVYQSSKAGLERFTQALARELAPDGLRVTIFRAGQMMDENSTSPFAPDVQMRFGRACKDAGIDLRARPITHFNSVAQILRALIDSPEDLQLGTVVAEARRP
jgi:meso-butanediol dehydrogenase / (S,S)-butanediol dehydrogenase / diacetyl reductase